MPNRDPDATLSPSDLELPAATLPPETLSGSATLPITGPESTLPAAPEVPERYVPTKGMVPSEIGRGAIGRVLVYRDRILGRAVARKELASGANHHASSFITEAKITAQLEHPNIVPIYELGRSMDGQPYYTMKWVRGRSLAEALQQCKNLGDRLKLLGHFVDVCHAVAYAHSRKVIHRDLKPQNVMVGEFGETVVLDWGLARTQDASDVTNEAGEPVAPHESSDGAIKGTPAYMSPEQARGENRRTGPASDIWSLGAMLYHILSARSPFIGGTFQIIHQVADEEVAPVASYCPDAPPELAAIAAKALQRDPANRYKDARELAEEVEAWQNGGLVKAYDYSSVELLARFARKNQLAFRVAIVAWLVLVVTVAAAWYQILQKEQTASHNLAESYIQRARSSLSSDNLPEAMEMAIKALELEERPDARGMVVAMTDAWAPKLVYRARLPRLPQLALRQLSVAPAESVHAGELALATTQGLAFKPARPPIYENILVAGASQQGWRYITSRGRFRQLEPEGSSTLTELRTTLETALILKSGAALVVTSHSLERLQPDGGISWSIETPLENTKGDVLVCNQQENLLAWGHKDGTLHLIDPETGQLQPALGDPWPGALALAFSPNGQYLASAGAEGSLDNNIRIWDIASRQLLQTFSGPAAAVSMLGFDASSTILIAGSKDRAVRFFERGSGRVLATRQPFNSRPVSLALPPKQERNVLLATSNGELAGYELPPLPPPLSRNHRLRHASFSPNGRYLATSTHRGAIELIETETGRLLLSSEGNGTDRPVSVDDQGRLLWAEPDGVVRIQESNGVESSFSAGARPLPVLLSPVKPLVLLWQNQQKNLEAWENGLMKWSREDPASTIRASFSPDGSRVAMVTEDLLSILDTETGAVQGLVTEIEGRQLVDWSEDGKLVAVSTEDFAIQLIDTMRYLPVLKTQVHHQDHIFQGCFFESSFVSSSRDWTIKIWSRSTGALQATIPTGTMDIVWLSCNQERQQVLGLSTDGQLIELDLARLMLPSSELQRLLAHQHALELSDSWEDIPWRPLNNQPVLRE